MAAEKAGQRHGASTNHDEQIRQELDAVTQKAGHRLSDILESFPVYVRRVTMTRFLAHYELYRRVAHLPGNVVQVGIYRGVSFFSWAKFLEIFHPGDRTRRVFGFDSFAGFTGLADEDGPPDEKWQKREGGWDAGPFRDELMTHVDLFHRDSFLPRAKRAVVIEGDITETAPKFAEDFPGLRISLLHLDVDLYEPTKAALEAFVPRMPKGGIIAFDELNVEIFPGETTAVQEVLGLGQVRIRRFPFDPYVSYCVIE